MNAEFKKSSKVEKEIDVELIEKEWKKHQQEALEKHDVKLMNIQKHLEALEQTHLTFEEFENVDAIKSKKRELELQRKEFTEHTAELRSKLNKLIGHNTSEMKAKEQELRKGFVRECHKMKVALPMYAERSRVLKEILENSVTIVTAETGSGKSTQMTQYLYEAGVATTGMIVCTQPRKVAALSLAEHVASEMMCTVGDEVGCKAGMRSRKNQKTKIIYMTDHALLKECVRDEKLSAYSCIIIDEAHERSIFTDLLLGMVKKCLDYRKDLKVIITSATIDPEVFVRYFSGCCPVITVSGRTFPVEVVWRDQYEDPVVDYVKEAVQKAKQVCQEEKAGDILVFLATPQETEKACEQLQNKVEDARNKLVCLPLHGKLQADDQKKVFDFSPPGKRKVVFATNSAETSITIPGIKFVIDAGYVKEKTYDAKRNMSSLDIVLINRSSAEQRKGRAGRTEPGKCFRLYTESTFLDMTPNSPPEILRVHLGQALLTLYELGIEDPLSFEFVESPSLESLQEAKENMTQLGALSAGKITPLGKKMVKLSLEPRLGKLVFEGIDHDVGYESLIIASFATVNGSVFFRMGSDEEKNRADQLKAQFGHSNGDLLSLLNVFKEWSGVNDQRAKTRWCLQKSINAKSMRIASETIREMRDTLRRDVGVNLDPSFNESEDVGDILARLIFNSFVANLCMFSGHERIGYNIARLHQCVHIHPSSCLKTEGIKPQWMVYEQLLKTSRDFALNVTPVKDEWVEEYAKENAIHFDIAEMRARKISPVVISNVGPHLMRALKGPMYKTVKGFEAQLQQIGGTNMLAIKMGSADVGGDVMIYIAEEYHKVAKELVETFLGDERQKLVQESYEEQLDDNVNLTRVVIGRGGMCTFILSPGEHKTLLIKASSQVTCDDVQNLFSKFGDIEQVIRFQGKKSCYWGKVVFSDTKDTDNAVVSTEGQRIEAVKPYYKPARPLVDPQKFEVLVDWCRRPRTGIGFITFESLEARCLATLHLRSLYLPESGCSASLAPAKNNEEQMFVGKLKPSVTEDELMCALNTKVVGGIKKIQLNRLKSFETTTKQFNAYKDELHGLVLSHAPSGFEIRGKVPQPSHIEYRLTINFNDVEEGLRALRYLNGFAVIDGIPLQMKAKSSTSIFVATPVFDVLKEGIEEALKEAEERYGMSWELKPTHRGSRWRVFMEGQDVKNLQRTKYMMHTLVEGDVIQCINPVLKRLFTKTAKEFFKKLMDKKKTYIMNDLRDMTVVIYGSTTVKTEVKIEINNFLDTYESYESKDIELCSDKMPKGLMKALIKLYDINFQQLKMKSGAQQIELIMKLRSLRVYGSGEAHEKVMAAVRQIADGMPQPIVPADQDIDCAVCWSPIDKADLLRLEFCGHPYCKDCTVHLVEHAIQDKEFPVACVKEGCNENLVRRDLTTVDKLRGDLLKKLKSAAVFELVQRENQRYHYCPTADCPNVYRVSGDGTKFICETCQSVVCTTCHTNYHTGLTCAQYKSYRENGGDDLLKEWMEKNSECRRACPRCSTPIEKNGGCAHVTCIACKIHICWQCGQLFRTGDECYDHQANCPRIWMAMTH